MNDSVSRSRRRRILVTGVLGLLLALAVIWFFTTVYDPFAEDVVDLAVLLPPDLDFVVACRDLPTFVKALEDRELYRRLDDNRDFARFLEDPIVRDTGVVPLLRESLRRIQGAGDELDLPFDLELLGDISGRQVVVGGKLPEDAAGTARFVAAFEPESAWGIVGVNALLDEMLAGLFVEDRLEGVTLRHRHWGAELEVAGAAGPEVWAVARVASAILVGNDVDLVARTVKRIETEGVPYERPPGLESDWVWAGAADASIDLALRRSALASRFDPVQRILIPSWGEDGARAFESFFPELTGDWVRVGFELDAMARLRVEVRTRERRGRDPFSTAAPIDRGVLQRELDQVVSQLPHEVFGYARLGAAPGEILTWALSDTGLIDRDKKLLWYEELTAFPRFRREFPEGSPPDLAADLGRELDACLEPGLGVALFRKRRDDGVLNAAPGFALIARLRDEGRMRGLLEEIDRTLAARDIRAFEVVEEAGATVWSVVNTSFLDAPDENRPGFAILPGHLVVTNWAGMLRDMLAVRRGEAAGYPSTALVRFNLDLLEHDPRVFVHVDSDPLYAYMDDAVEGWVRDRSAVSDLEVFARRRELEIEATRANIPAGQREGWLDRRMMQWKAEAEQARNPVLIRRDIERHLGYFRDAFAFFFASAGLNDDRLRVEARLDARRR